MRSYRIIGFILSLSTLLTACQASDALTIKKSQPLRVGYSDSTSDYVLLIAKEMGFFEKAGIEVDPIHYSTFSDSYIDLAIGKIDAINAVAIDLLPIIENDNLRAVMVTANSAGGDAIIAAPGITSISDLRGKRIGVALGTYGELLIKEMLKEGGLSFNDVIIVDVSPEQVPNLLPLEIDAGHTWEPHISRAISNGYHVIFSSLETRGVFPDLMTFRSQVVTDRPADIRAFVIAWLEAAEFWKSNPIAGDIIISQITNREEADISFQGVQIYSLEDNVNAFAQNPGNNTSSIYYVVRLSLDFAITEGYISTPPNIDILLDPSYLPFK